MKQPSDVYPSFTVVHIPNPNRIFAIPIIGFFIKFFACIPQFIILFFVMIAVMIMVFIINPFAVLFTGEYLEVAHSLIVGMQNLGIKVSLYFFGLTNKYPGFNLSVNGDFTLDIPKPKKPNRLFAIPFFGGLARYILLIPFLLYSTVVEYAAMLGAVGSSFVVLFTGKYPESMYELIRDWHRLNLATALYLVGIYDSYPSFWISMNHKNIKIALIALMAIYMLFYQMFSFAAGIGSVMSGSYKYKSPAYKKEMQYNYDSSDSNPQDQIPQYPVR